MLAVVVLLYLMLAVAGTVVAISVTVAAYRASWTVCPRLHSCWRLLQKVLLLLLLRGVLLLLRMVVRSRPIHAGDTTVRTDGPWLLVVHDGLLLLLLLKLLSGVLVVVLLLMLMLLLVGSLCLWRRRPICSRHRRPSVGSRLLLCLGMLMVLRVHRTVRIYRWC